MRDDVTDRPQAAAELLASEGAACLMQNARSRW
jgi:hypothetical protein